MFVSNWSTNSVACLKGHQGIQSIPKTLSSSLIRAPFARMFLLVNQWPVYPDIFATVRHFKLLPHSAVVTG